MCCGERHEEALSRVGMPIACRSDRHALVPVPGKVLRLGPDDPRPRLALGQLGHDLERAAGSRLSTDAGEQAALRRNTGSKRDISESGRDAAPTDSGESSCRWIVDPETGEIDRR